MSPRSGPEKRADAAEGPAEKESCSGESAQGRRRPTRLWPEAQSNQPQGLAPGHARLNHACGSRATSRLPR